MELDMIPKENNDYTKDDPSNKGKFGCFKSLFDCFKKPTNSDKYKSENSANNSQIPNIPADKRYAVNENISQENLDKVIKPAIVNENTPQENLDKVIKPDVIFNNGASKNNDSQKEEIPYSLPIQGK
ncbi:MAG: hypothetical protein LBI81_01550 [Puniceicoccales bacterium]|jgi:hypothetical protein|nr:hypothetical protein [Puniceicoccales bacterium]